MRIWRSPALSSTRLSTWRTLRSSSGVPVSDGNTHAGCADGTTVMKRAACTTTALLTATASDALPVSKGCLLLRGDEDVRLVSARSKRERQP